MLLPLPNQDAVHLEPVSLHSCPNWQVADFLSLPILRGKWHLLV